MEFQPSADRPERNPVHLPRPRRHGDGELRYRCAGEYCPEPGPVHPAGRLFLDVNVAWPGFFCATCRPKPMLPGIPPPQTLAEYLRTMPPPERPASQPQQQDRLF